MTLEAFVDRLASAEPIPGGGSASAVAGSLGAALVSMVASLSEGRPRYAAHAALHASAGAAGRDLASRFLALADDDATAYSRYVAAMKMPRETVEERSARAIAIATAARAAADPPFTCVEACLEVVTAAEALVGRSNVNAASDLDVAALLAEAAARGAAANVKVNLPAAADDAWAAETSARVDALLDRIADIAAATRAAVASGASRP